MYTFTKLYDRHIPNVGVRVGVGPVEFQLYGLAADILATMSQGCYEENGPVEFKLSGVMRYTR